MNSKQFKKPDLKAPRFRPDVYQVMNQELFDSFREKHPRYKNMTDAQLRKIGKTFNTMLWETVIDTRDGVQLPEGLGYIFIGTCKASKKKNVDYAKSHKYGKMVTQTNWDTDGKLAKIFYTNYANKYKFINRECWRFQASRTFKRTVAKTYPENWPVYVEVDPHKKIRKIFQKNTMKHKSQDKDLGDYNEFNI